MNRIRIEVAGSVIRLFAERRDAINAANGRTRLSREQHREKKYEAGYLVENVVVKKLFDEDGEIPEAAAKKIYGS